MPPSAYKALVCCSGSTLKPCEGNGSRQHVIFWWVTLHECPSSVDNSFSFPSSYQNTIFRKVLSVSLNICLTIGMPVRPHVVLPVCESSRASLILSLSTTLNAISSADQSAGLAPLEALESHPLPDASNGDSRRCRYEKPRWWPCAPL